MKTLPSDERPEVPKALNDKTILLEKAKGLVKECY